MKKRLFILLFLLFIITSKKAKAASFSYIWENNYLNIPLNSDINLYVDYPIAKLYDNQILLNDADIYYSKGVNGTSLSTINTNVVNTYRVDYEATSSNYDNYTETQSIYFNIVDLEAPVMNIYDDLKVEVFNDIVDDNNYVCVDNYYTDLNIAVDFSNVNKDIIGHYNAIYTLTDNSNNVSIYNRKINVVDNEPPVIMEPKDLTININDNSFDPYKNVLAYDNYDGDITKNIKCDSRNLRTDEFGTYDIFYSVIDSSNNRSVYSIKYTVADIEKPIITIKNNIISIECGESFDLYSNIDYVSDNIDNLKIEDIEIIGAYDTSIQGTYNLFYKISDTSNNTLYKKVDIYVYDNVSPKIIAQNKIVDSFLFDPYENIKAFDNIEGDITNRITIENIEITNNQYIINYSVRDISGNYTNLLVYYSLRSNTSEYNNIIPVFPDEAISIPSKNITTENVEKKKSNNYIIGIVIIVTGLIIALYCKKKK